MNWLMNHHGLEFDGYEDLWAWSTNDLDSFWRSIWSSCSPEMGRTMVLDRFSQIEPKLLFAVDSYSYKGELHDRSGIVQELIKGLPSVSHVVHVLGPLAGERQVGWRDVLAWTD